MLLLLLKIQRLTGSQGIQYISIYTTQQVIFATEGKAATRADAKFLRCGKVLTTVLREDRFGVGAWRRSHTYTLITSSTPSSINPFIRRDP
jgi:hypothetical protein